LARIEEPQYDKNLKNDNNNNNNNNNNNPSPSSSFDFLSNLEKTLSYSIE